MYCTASTLLMCSCLSMAAIAATVFDAARIHIDTELLQDGQDVSDDCNVGVLAMRSCSKVGDVVCISAANPTYTCTDQDIVNETTRAAATLAMASAIDKLAFLMVNRAASLDLAQSQWCQKEVGATAAADHVTVMTMRPSDSASPGSTILCVFSSVDGRPVVSNINIPPASTGGPSTLLEGNALRLIIQALGFDLSAVPKYIASYDDGQPRTYYAYDPSRYPNGPLALVGPMGVADSSTPTVAAGVLLDDNTVDAYVRDDGRVRMQLRTPRVVAAAKEHFGCPTIGGVLLEERNPAWMRWERRQLNMEVMGSGFNPPTANWVLSKMTIGALEDMGFYQVNHTLAHRAVGTLLWGLGMGCAFAEGCSPSSWQESFCNVSGAAVGFDGTYWGSCQVVSYGSSRESPGYIHFADPELGGADPFADYCPYVPTYSATDPDPSYTVCTDTSGGHAQSTVSLLDSTRRCATCRVARANLVNMSFLAAGNTTTGPPYCMEVACLNATHMGVRVGQRYITCMSNELVAFTFPPAHPSYVPPPTGTSWTDYVYNGLLQCPQVSYMCQPAMGAHAPFRSNEVGTILTAMQWPQLVDLDPPHGSVAGEEVITVRGRNLFPKSDSTAELAVSCRGLWIGGVSTAFESYERVGTNATTGYDVFTVNTTRMPQVVDDEEPALVYVGGGGDDGSGVVDVALLCKIPGVLECANEWDEGGGFSDGYCALGTVRGGFTLTSIPPPPPETYFLSDPTNQVIIISIFAAVMLCVIALICRYCASTYAAPDGLTIAKLQDRLADGSDNESVELNMQELADMADAAEAPRL